MGYPDPALTHRNRRQAAGSIRAAWGPSAVLRLQAGLSDLVVKIERPVEKGLQDLFLASEPA
jgi:hypothetical protein